MQDRDFPVPCCAHRISIRLPKLQGNIQTRFSIGERTTRRGKELRASLIALTVILSSGCPVPVRTLPVGRKAQKVEVYGTVAITGRDFKPFCSGTAIAPQLVVTAAHCVSLEEPKDVLVSSGYLHVEDTLSWHFIGVRKIIPYPGFPNVEAKEDIHGMGRWDDIALLVLEKPVRVAWIPILPLTEARRLLRKGKKVLISGYGRTNGKSGVLHVATTSYRRRTNYEFWLGGVGESDHCSGDSGGPTYLRVGKQLYLVGVASRFGRGQKLSCAVGGGINTLISAYTTWITADSKLYPPTGAPPPMQVGCSSSNQESTSFGFLLVALLLWRIRRTRRKWNYYRKR